LDAEKSARRAAERAAAEGLRRQNEAEDRKKSRPPPLHIFHYENVDPICINFS